ncbi:MAG: hypothetical protein DDT41_01285 [candidate division WS2 bacterium]|nr:hypothetical protein [Candidatus Psychracetigena formicireducens]
MRTEEEKILKTNIVVVFGNKEYEIKPLVIKESRKWRDKFTKVLGSLPQYTSITTETPDRFQEAISAMMMILPEKLIDLVFDYAPELNRKEIEMVATDAEMARAFEQIVEVSFPLVKSLVGVMGKLSA